METRARIAGLVIHDGKLLMLHGKGYLELWTPGGKTDNNESDGECLKRQLKEEIGVTLREANLFKEYRTYSFYHEKRSMIERVYIVKIEGEITPKGEIENIVWLTKEDFAEKKFPISTHIEKELIPDLIREGIW